MSPRRIVCLTEETTETLYLLGEGERVVGVAATPCGRRKRGRSREISSFLHAKYDKIAALDTGLDSCLSRTCRPRSPTELVTRGYPVLSLSTSAASPKSCR